MMEVKVGYEPDTIEDWFEDVVADLPTHALLDLLEQCIAGLGSDVPTLH